MGNSNPHNAAAQAEVEEAHLREQTRRQEAELERQRDALVEARMERARLREEERQRADELEKEDQRRLEKLLEDDQKRKDAERARIDLQSSTQDSQLRKALEEGNKVLDNLREANSKDSEKRADRHKESLTNVAKQHERVEEKTAKRVLDLTDQGSKAQDELHKERAGYFDKKLTVYKEHYAKIEKLEFTKTEFLVKREESAVEHQERLHIMKAGFAVQTQKVHIARGLDRVETNFVDAVNNIRGGDDGLRSAVGSFSRLETCLTNGLPLERAVNQALAAQTRAIASLAVLHDNAAAILDQEENKTEDAVKCHASARTILRLIGEIRKPLDNIRVFLCDGLSPEQKTSAIETITQIQNLSRQLAEAIINMPVVHRQDHVKRQIMQNVEAIVNMKISGKVETPAVKGRPDGGGVVEAPAIEEAPEGVVEEAPEGVVEEAPEGVVEEAPEGVVEEADD